MSLTAAAVSIEYIVLRRRKKVIIILKDVKVTKFTNHHHSKDMI
jgi:hypothetical protein